MNNVTLTGRLTQDPEQRTAGDLLICNLRLAVPRRKGRGGEDRGAVYIDVVCFGPLAKVCDQYLAKGRRAAVQGRLELDEWEAADGTPRRRHKVVADQVEFLDPAQPRHDDEPPADEVAA
ncbi:MAG: single-stranded DNA-binding protein, partial [Solirubrobacteraceae bacterium]